MTTTDSPSPAPNPDQAPPHAVDDGEHTIRDVAHALAQILAEENVSTVFGEPQRLDTHVVVPVARVEVGIGGGGVRALGAAVDAVRDFVFARGARREQKKEHHVRPARSLALGGGGGIKIVPIGFLHEEDGHIVYTPIATSP